MNPRIARRIAWSLVGLYIVLAGTGLFLIVLTNTTLGDVRIPILLFIIALFVIGIWPVIGALIVTHHPRHPVGWLLSATLPLGAIDMFAIGYASYATLRSPGSLPIPGAMLIWLNWSAEPFVLVTFMLLNLSFPTGKLLSLRWRIVAWTGVAALPVFLALQTLEPGPVAIFPSLDNPYAAGDPVWAALLPFFFVVMALLMLCSLASLVSLFLRLRRAQGDERQQIKWLVFPATVYWISQPFGFLADYDPSGTFLVLGVVLVLISIPMMVIAVAFAIFRYRLYDLDLIINRTLVYGALSGTLVLVYFMSVVLLERIFPAGSQISIVLSTLAIAALFSPLRRRIQNDIDRRFYRRKYDAQQILAAFGTTIRDEVELQQLSETLLAVVDETMQPASAWLWLKKSERIS